jgi:DNA polymerase III epsilon subunit-like protein
MKEVYISVDVEAAGPVPPTYSLLSIGAVPIDKPSSTFYIEIQPINTNFVPAAMQVVGRSLEQFQKTGKPQRDAMTAFSDWIEAMAKGAKPVFVGFNATFDWAFVNFYFHEYLGENPFGIGGIDIKAFYMGLSGCAWEDTKSSKIPSRFKGESVHTHNALDDAIEQAEMFHRMRERAAGKG